MNPVTIQTSLIQRRSKKQQRRRTVTSVATSCDESNCNTTSITKTISNYFFKPQRIPQAIEERNHYKTITTKPFFAKNRKLSQENKKMRRDNNPVVVPNTFKNILRAKSTVIKQARLQEFYINRQGRSDLQRSTACLIQTDDSKTNLFRPNFMHKKAKPTRKNSHYLEKYKKCLNSKELSLQTIELPKQPLQHSQGITEYIRELALKEKQPSQNNSEFIPFKKKFSFGDQSLPLKYHRRQKKKLFDKQNLQFQLQPWAAQECDDFTF